MTPPFLFDTMLRFALLVIFSTATFALAGPINPRVTMAARQIVPRRAPETTTTVLTAPSIEPTGTPKPPAENGDVKLWGLTDVVVPVNLADKPKTGKICLPKHGEAFGACMKILSIILTQWLLFA